MRKHFGKALVVLLLGLVAGCSGYRNYRQAQIATQVGNWDEAVLYYMKALEGDPGNIQYQAALLRAKIEASQAHFEKAKKFQEAGVLDRALIELQQAVELDPTNQYAEAELGNVRDKLAALRENREKAGSIAEMKEKARGKLPQPPMLSPRSNQPISLNFPEPTGIFQIYRALGKAFGINVLFDPNLKDQDITIDLQDVTAQTALETLMRTAGHFYKVLDEHTILIAADTPQNRRNYEDLVIQTFFLSNAEVKDMMTILRSLIDARKIATNEQLNAIILRDTADKVKVAEKIIEANDKAKAEVVVDVELLQIDTSKIRELGVNLSQYSLTQSLDLGGEDVALHLSDLKFLNQSNWALTVPNFIYNFIKTNTDAQLLAKPRLRITDGETAQLLIGDRVPIPVTTFNTANTVGSNVVPITSFQYQDVGIQIQIEPRVHHNKEITLKVKVEVSNIAGFVPGSGGQQQPRIGTRTIDSTIRLRDGETNFLAGLIRSDDTSQESGVPGLSNIPILGRLFSNKRRTNERTDVIMTLTPHIIRNAEITEEDLLPIWVGTESNISFRGGSPRVESDVEGPFDGTQGTPEEIQEMMRQRIQRLPRGLRPDQGGAANGQGQQQTPPTQPGQNLVPGTTPPSIFDRQPQSPQGQQPIEPQTPPEQEQRPPNQTSFLSSGAGQAGPSADPATPPSPPSSASRSSGVTFANLDGAATASQPATTAADHAPTTPTRMWLIPRSLAVAPGDEFEVLLQASSATPVSHLPVTLGFDPEVLAVEKVDAGDFLGAADEWRLLSDSSQAGRLVLGLSRLGQVGGVTGSGVVARITLRALKPGESSLTFQQAQALGPDRSPIAVSVDPAVVTVAEPPPVPQRPRRLGEGPGT